MDNDDSIYDQLHDDELEIFENLIFALQKRLSLINLKQRINVEVRRFKPVNVSGVLMGYDLTKAEEEFMDKFEETIFSNFSTLKQDHLESIMLRPLRFLLNANNEIVQHLSRLPDLTHKKYDHILVSLYNASFINSNQMNSLNSKIIYRYFHEHLLDSIKLKEKVDELEQALKVNTERGFPNHSQLKKNPYVQVFIMMSYKKEYEVIENAFRRIFELSPYHFKVHLARDGFSTRNLRQNIQNAMAESHIYIAEISENSPNVFLELGWTIFDPDMDDRVKILVVKNGVNPPVDLSEFIYHSYPNLEAENLESLLREQLSADRQLQELVERREQKYLSPLLLEHYEILANKEIRERICRKYMTVESFLLESEEGFSKFMGKEAWGNILEDIKKYIKSKL